MRKWRISVIAEYVDPPRQAYCAQRTVGDKEEMLGR
jgi:hypothetical protein